jgi:hypothetical protein
MGKAFVASAATDRTGGQPLGTLIRHVAGDLYGTTVTGGNSPCQLKALTETSEQASLASIPTRTGIPDNRDFGDQHESSEAPFQENEIRLDLEGRVVLARCSRAQT